METTGKVGDLMRRKGGAVWWIGPTASVYDAVVMMADKQIGALLVMNDDQLLGIVSERDYARKVVLLGRSSHETPVTEIMSSPVATVTPDATVGDCMRMVTERRFRHLPVVENGKVTGMVSIGDLVNWVVTEQQATIRHLEAWIAGTPG
ncbi:MAG TPA: CBS domain-containing protein [Acidobacteriaceae bacterium]